MTIWDILAALTFLVCFPPNALRYYLNHRRNADHLILDPNFGLMFGAAVLIIAEQIVIEFRTDPHLRALIFLPLGVVWLMLTGLVYQLDRRF